MRRFISLTSLCLLFASTVALGDWDEGDPAKWVQLPDLSPLGLDVKATDLVLADDFLCTEPIPITDIHIWGSWPGDWYPWGEMIPDQVEFRLSIHADIPAEESATGYSMPGELLWEEWFSIGDFDLRLYAEALEGWYDPDTGEYLEDDHEDVWQYNFYPERPFQQEGTQDEPIVYWLDVQAFPTEEGKEFGWKTSANHWNDGAVWTDEYDEIWYDMYYPETEESLDMAFVITPEPATVCLLGLGALSLLRRKRSV